MKRKLNMSILGLSAVLEETASAAANRIIPWKFMTREKTDRLKQTPANPARKARRKMIQASQRRNRI